MWFCLYQCFTEVILLKVTSKCDGLMSVSSIWWTYFCYLHSLCGNILFFGFCDTTQVFFLPLAVSSHSLCGFFLLFSTCMCWIFWGAPCASLSPLSPWAISFIPLALRPYIYPWLSYSCLSSFDLTYFKLQSYIRNYWLDIFRYMFPRHLQLNTFSVEHLISPPNYFFFYLIPPLFTWLFKLDNWVIFFPLCVLPSIHLCTLPQNSYCQQVLLLLPPVVISDLSTLPLSWLYSSSRPLTGLPASVE